MHGEKSTGAGGFKFYNRARRTLESGREKKGGGGGGQIKRKAPSDKAAMIQLSVLVKGQIAKNTQ